ncbi:hypothetical protein VIGAN_02292800 [Vigna angularis var. angularis]|uniref:Uncharacterized protein n=1 Tax=Vigna angularis var. angularis TaxID=157739 RepID=A0A0S3RHC8_PHAAN|nr:hypothetical protein VIGAN_02292800 [Vigna angularis var. angularis]
MVDAALWIPSHFLVAHDHHINNVHFHAPFAFPSEFHYDLGLSSSPLKSLASSTETESSDDKEDFFAALTRRLSFAPVDLLTFWTLATKEALIENLLTE